MRVNHIVVIRFKDGVGAERIAHHLAGLAGLRGSMPEIITDLSVGTNFTDRANGYTHAVVVTLPERAALPLYLAHPAHVAVATGLRADADYIVLDYEF